MNTVRTFALTVARNYSRRIRKRDTVGILKQLTLAKKTSFDKENAEEHMTDPDDLSIFETDLANLDKLHDMHNREMTEKKIQLQRHITARKYFKKIDPSFLTFAERDKLRKMHEDDPGVWTAERLSEQFPALPDSIAKVLRATWVPRTIEEVVRYDKKVAENWKQFHAGKLAVDLPLREHLNKFGKRKIDLEHSKNVAQHIIVPLPEVPKPKQQIFSKMVTQLIGVTQEESKQNLVSAKEDKSNLEAGEQLLRKTKLPHREGFRKQTLDQFIERNYNSITKQAPTQENILIKAYEKYHEKKLENAQEKISERSESLVTENSKTSIKVTDQPTSVNLMKADVSVNTIVISRKAITNSTPTYIYPIKIPKGAYQKGKLYRINDCYYDDDGEFLYRIPGMKA